MNNLAMLREAIKVAEKHGIDLNIPNVHIEVAGVGEDGIQSIANTAMEVLHETCHRQGMTHGQFQTLIEDLEETMFPMIEATGWIGAGLEVMELAAVMKEEAGPTAEQIGVFDLANALITKGFNQVLAAGDALPEGSHIKVIGETTLSKQESPSVDE